MRWVACTPDGGFLIVLRPEGQCFFVLLPELTSSKVVQWHDLLHPEAAPDDGLARSPLRAPQDRDSFPPSPAAVEHVLEELSSALGSVGDWWADDAWLVPVGLLATLPWQTRWPGLRLHTSGALHAIAFANSARPAPPSAAGVLTAELAGTEEEAKSLRDHLSATVLAGSSACLGRLADLGPLGVLHFGVHGTTEPALVLADGNLLPDDVPSFGDQFKALRLLFANACFSGSLGSDTLDEAVGFATASAVAGTAATLGALWPVHSETAARFAEAFYGNFKAHRDPHRALSHARASTEPFGSGDTTLASYQLWGH